MEGVIIESYRLHYYHGEPVLCEVWRKLVGLLKTGKNIYDSFEELEDALKKCYDQGEMPSLYKFSLIKLNPKHWQVECVNGSYNKRIVELFVSSRAMRLHDSKEERIKLEQREVRKRSLYRRLLKNS